jgi:hypothetical protein
VKRAAMICAGVLYAAPAAAQVDVLEQHIDVDVTAPDSTELRIDLQLEAGGAVDSLTIPKPLLPVVGVTVDGVMGSAAPHPSYPDELTEITFPAALAPGQQALVSIELSGEASCAVTSAVCVRTPEETVFTFSSPGAAWYYVNVFGVDSFVGTVSVLAPADQTVVSGQGAPITEETVGPNKHWVFAFDEPTEILGLYAGVVEEKSAAGPPAVRALYHASRHDEDDVSLAVEVVSGVVPIYEDFYGPLPVDEIHLVTVPSNFGFGAAGLLGNVFVNEVVFSTHDYLVEQGMAHEIAHSWWGNLASAAFASEAPFLQEAFAEYSAWRGLGVLRGAATRVAGMRMNAVWYMYRRPDNVDVEVLSPSAQGSPAYVFVTYHKGALAIRALEEMVGADDFGAALQSFVARGYGQLSVDGLIEDVASASGYDATTFVSEWLRHTGFPLVLATPAVDGGEVSLALDVAGEFHLHVPLRFTFADGSRQDEAVEAGPGRSEHAFSLPERPVAVEVDPDWSMTREVNPALFGDVTLDGAVDAADLVEVALRSGAFLPEERRVDGGYDPLHDVDRNRLVDDLDLEAVHQAALTP